MESVLAHMFRPLFPIRHLQFLAICVYCGYFRFIRLTAHGSRLTANGSNMQLAIVRGRATSTVKHPSLEGAKLLVCQLLGNEWQAVGDPILALDRIGAGQGDVVTITSDGLGLREMLNCDNSPARWWTLGIVDEESHQATSHQATERGQ